MKPYNLCFRFIYLFIFLSALSTTASELPQAVYVSTGSQIIYVKVIIEAVVKT